MKKYLGMLLIGIMVVTLTACSSNNKESNSNSNEKNTEKTVSEILKDAGYKETLVDAIYKKEFDNEIAIVFNLQDKTITYETEKDLMTYDVKNNTADMYGCRYHYSDDTTSEDGDGFGGCKNETIEFLKTSKEELDKELKNIDITYDKLK